VRVKVVKNKVAPPFRMAEFDIIYGKGISKEGSLLDVGVDHDIVKKSGAWFTYEDEQLGQGRENARQFLQEHADVALEIERRVHEAVGLSGFTEEDDEVVDLEGIPEADPEPVVEADAERAPEAEDDRTAAKAGS
jgi:recombination protein RecA